MWPSECYKTHRNLLNPNLGVVPLGLQLELDVQTADLRVLERLGLLLESGITERLLERDTLHQKRILHTSSRDLLDTDERLVQIGLVEREDGVNNHGAEEGLLRVDEFGRHGGGGTLEEKRAEVPASA